MVWQVSAWEYFQMGGWVMVPLTCVGLFLAFFLTERLHYFFSLRKADISTDAMMDILQGFNSDNQKGSGLRSQLLKRFFLAKEIYGKLDDMIIEEVKKGFAQEFKKSQHLIATLTAVAPLLGLLGTVSGMIYTFNVLTIFGTGNARAMSNGISEALITTQYGLEIAIVGLFFFSVIQRWARQCDVLTQEIAKQIVRRGIR